MGLRNGGKTVVVHRRSPDGRELKTVSTPKPFDSRARGNPTTDLENLKRA